ncbi:MAG: hypothetical protein JWP76_4679 [Dactylosporangium sp.]|jgi:hypothetical protein|nr:hypothetical protein [Dactylosporangium sp.]
MHALLTEGKERVPAEALTLSAPAPSGEISITPGPRTRNLEEFFAQVDPETLDRFEERFNKLAV